MFRRLCQGKCGESESLLYQRSSHITADMTIMLSISGPIEDSKTPNASKSKMCYKIK